jgi:hypothetical protein
MKTSVKRYCSTYAKLHAKLHSSFFPDNARSGHTRFVRTKLRAKLVHSFLTTQRNLVTARSGLSFSGYAQTFPRFLAALQGGASSNAAGPVTVDLDSDMAAVDQPWDEVHGVIDATNTWMEPFLLLFGVTKGN